MFFLLLKPAFPEAPSPTLHNRVRGIESSTKGSGVSDRGYFLTLMSIGINSCDFLSKFFEGGIFFSIKCYFVKVLQMCIMALFPVGHSLLIKLAPLRKILFVDNILTHGPLKAIKPNNFSSRIK